MLPEQAAWVYAHWHRRPEFGGEDYRIFQRHAEAEDAAGREQLDLTPPTCKSWQGNPMTTKWYTLPVMAEMPYDMYDGGIDTI